MNSPSMNKEPDFFHGCLGTLVVLLFLLVIICALADRDDFKTVNRWELYGVKVIRSQSTDLPSLQNQAQELLEKNLNSK